MPRIPMAIAMIALGGLSGCHHADPPTGQVLAKVGDREITASQFQDALQSLPPGKDPRDPAVRAATLQRLVDITLLAEGGAAAGLDKVPEVARRIEAARRTILAGAYVDQGMSLTTSPADLRAFYASHESQFARRNVYAISEIAATGDDAARARAVALFKAPHASLEGTREALRKLGIATTPTHREMRSDRLPQPVADRFAKMKAGALFSLNVGRVEMLGRIDRITPDPVRFEDAMPELRTGLLQLRVQQQSKAKLAEARDRLPVQYGEMGSDVLASRAPTTPGENYSDMEWPH